MGKARLTENPPNWQLNAIKETVILQILESEP